MSNLLQDALDLPNPTLVEADENGRVDSLKLLNGGNVSICYDDMRKTDRITLNWPLAGSPYPPIEPRNGDDAGCISVYIPPEYIALWLDNFVLFTYTVTRDGENQTSLQADVWISLPSNLPQVQILKATDGKLDLSLLCCKDPILYLPPWVFADTIQTIECYIGGIYPDGSKARLYPFKDEPVTDEDIRLGWRRAIPRELFQQLKHDSELFILASVRFSRSTPYRSFPSLLLTLLTEPHLELSPPDLKEAVHTEFDGWVVNPINTVNGAHIIVGYEGMCAGDTVCPSFSGTPGSGTPVLECRQPVEGETSLVFAVPPSAIRANFKQAITLTYDVTRCDGSQWPSPERRVKVLGITGLPKSNIEQSTGTRLDLNTFRGDATGVVPIWSYAIEQDCCWMWVTGTLEDGSDYCFYVLEGMPLDAAWLHDGVDTPIDRTQLQKLADCSEFELHFAANFDGQCALESAVEFPVRTFSIEQEALTLPPPRVCEAMDDQLTIWNGRNGVTVRVEYERVSSSHEIEVKWVKPDGTSLPLESKPGNSDPGYVDFAVPREAVIQAAGKTILIHYIVTSTCKLAPSKTLALKISVPTRLPTPVVPEATPPATKGGILDLRSFTGDAHITVEKWWFILAGQVGWLECRGTQEDGSPCIIRVMPNEPITAGDVADGILRVLKREDLEKLRNRTALDVVFKCTAEIGGHEASAIEFPVLHLEFRKAFYDYTDFNPAGKDWNSWQRGPGATDSRDLRLKQGQVPPDFANGYYREDWGYTNTTNPATQREKMFKNFTALEVGKQYEFSAWIRDSYPPGTGRKPALVLVVQGVDITSITRPGTAWELLKGTFQASSSSLRLSLDNMEMGIDPVNDFDVTGITVKEI